MNFSTFKEFFTFNELLHNQGTFPHSRNCSTVKQLFHIEKKIPANKDQKASLKAKSLDPLFAKSDAKIFLAL